MITGLDGDIFEGERYIAQAVDVLQWGRRAWKDVSPNLRGTVFSDTFVRGVRCMHLQKYMEVCHSLALSLSIALRFLLMERQNTGLCKESRNEQHSLPA